MCFSTQPGIEADRVYLDHVELSNAVFFYCQRQWNAVLFD